MTWYHIFNYLCSDDRRDIPVRNALHLLLQLLLGGMRIQGKLESRSWAELNQTNSHLHGVKIQEFWLTGCEDGDGERKRYEPYLAQFLALDRVWLRSVWTSRSCLSQRCRNHPWGREYPRLLSTASLPIQTNTHRINHTGCRQRWVSGNKVVNQLHTFLNYTGFPGWMSNGLVQTKIAHRRNKRTLHAKAQFSFLVLFFCAHIKPSKNSPSRTGLYLQADVMCGGAVMLAFSWL